jgi:hypothetical protein
VDQDGCELSFAETAFLGALAGLTIYLGLPIGGRIDASRPKQLFLGEL